ncbi:MAG: hypothetical protein LBI42_08070 [Chitinispirillales bacterium]|jgi:uncharacterized spore protein YtfJ|nr:hypothetical protein [Chitinispirillales bacterium]
MALSEVIKTALDHIQYIAKTETVIGEPIKAGDITLIPVSKVSVGFAAGGGGKNSGSDGAGTGGGINVTPVAFISICGSKVEVLSLEDGEPTLEKLLLSMAPDVIRKISKYFKKSKDEKTEDDEG